jgi:hypothetical protein
MTSRVVAILLVAFVVSIPLAAWAVEVGVALTASHLLAMVLAGVAGMIWLRDRRSVPLGPAGIALLAFFVVAASSVVQVQFEPDIQIMGESAHEKSIKQLIGLVFGLVVFTSLRCVMYWHGLAPVALRAHFWTTAAVAVLALLQYGVASWDLEHALANWPVLNSTFGGTRPLSLMYGFPRVSLSMVEPSMLATYLLTGWAFWLFVWERPKGEHKAFHALFTASGVVIGIAIVTSGSRLAYVVIAAMTLAAICLRPFRAARLGLVAASVAIGLLLTGPDHSRRLLATLVPRPSPVQAPGTGVRAPEPGVSSSADRAEPAVPSSGEAVSAADRAAPGAVGETIRRAVDDTVQSTEMSVARNDPSVQQRVASYLISVVAIRERPWLGIGFGTSAFYMGRHWPAAFTPLSQVPSAAPVMMSHYATILTETGLLGALCVLAFAGAVLVELWRSRRRLLDRRLTAGVAAALAAYALAGTATALVVYQSLLIWLLLAAALTLQPTRQGKSVPLGDV